MKSARPALVAALAAFALSACEGSSRAVGTATSIIVIAPDSVWSAIDDSVYSVLEPRIHTVRSERTFEVTQISPSDPKWQELREFRQVVAIGHANDAWVQPIVQGARMQSGGAGVAQARDVWARNQLALAVTLPEGAAPEAALPHVERVGAVIDSLFRIYVVQRMYTSDADSALADSLRSQHGFSILLPKVYSPVAREGNALLYHNNTVVGGDLARSVLITWRDGIEQPTAEAAIAWRDSIVYNPPQRTLQDTVRTESVSSPGATGVEVMGGWEGTDPSWPMGGLFITRMMTCAAQNRTYLIDTWLYAPGPRRSKYEYMIQLQTILGTFECE